MIFPAMHSDCEWLTRSIYDPAVFWSMASAVATAILLVVAWRQLRSLAKTSRSDFLYRLKSDFFTKEARQLVFLANEELLHFNIEPEIPYFEIIDRNSPGVTDRLKELDIEAKSISIYSVDDVLLGPMEDIAVFEKLKLIGRNEVYEVFGEYLNICIESQGLKEYLEWSREGPRNSDVWENLLNLHRKLKKKFPE
jgi:hypothetical protein